MNKKLYIEKEECLKEVQKLYFIVYHLQTFLSENENNFKREESINALKKIRTYLESTKKKYYDSESKYQELKRKLSSTCDHEIAIKRNNRSYECLICDYPFGWNNGMVPEEPLISIDTTKDYETDSIIEKIFKYAIYSDKDLIEEISNEISEMQYDKDIKVYRRSR